MHSNLFFTAVLTIALACASCNNTPTCNNSEAQPAAINKQSVQVDIAKLYSQAIGDYIKLVRQEYGLTFDTLYFGKHVQGQADDFPDIALPAQIENTTIKLISPEHGTEIMNKCPSSYYINLFSGGVADNTQFIFVTFSNGFAHQFDCFINYNFDNNKMEYVMESKRFEVYKYKNS